MLRKIQQAAGEIEALSQGAGAAGPPPPVLQAIDLRVARGTLCCLIGKVGSGKTALLHAILGEMVQVGGDVTLAGSVSYAAQSAFILNATVKSNIVFGSDFDEARYLTVVQGCALVADLQTLPDGDATEIGERGVNLSGGQRQRLGLARALYRRADTYLLDDPLSAVDAHVGRHMWGSVALSLCTTANRFVLPLIHFIPDSLRDLVPLFRNRQCDRALGTSWTSCWPSCGRRGGRSSWPATSCTSSTTPILS